MFSLTEEDVESSGIVWENQEKNIDKFQQVFADMASRVEILTRD